MCIVSINGEDHITAEGALDELKFRRTPRGTFKVKINIFRRKSYQRTDLEDILSVFDQVRPVVSNIEVRLPKKSPTQKTLVKV